MAADARSRGALVAELARRERAVLTERPRTPEPMAITDPEAVAAFHQAGEIDGPMLVMYEVYARSLDRLLAPGGLVLDLGCGSARCIAHFAAHRPDAQIIGVDLSDEMIRKGAELVDALGLSSRIRLIAGDICDPATFDGIEPAVAAASISLHHLPSSGELDRFADTLAGLVARTGCGVFLFDLARLRHPDSYRALLKLTPAWQGILLDDALASEAAAWTQAEMAAALASVGLDLHSAATAPLAILQTHWSAGVARVRDRTTQWHALDVPQATAAEAAAIDRSIGVGRAGAAPHRPAGGEPA